jgi:inosose dehydratase
MLIKDPRLVIGHTAITWADENAEAGIRCIAELGFHNIEIFAWVLKNFYESGRKDICRQYNIPLVSSYYSVDIVNPNLRDSETAKLKEWTDIAGGMGGKFATFGGNSVDRRTFKFREHKKYIVDFVNEAARLLNEKGVGLNFHPHTGTPVETEEEIVEFLDAIDTNYVGFAPDIGQIQKGGADPMRFIKDYISIIKLIHFKDYCGSVRFDDDGKEIDTSGFACYVPLGQGVVDLKGILEYLEQSSFNGPVMIELDYGPSMPIRAEEAAAINKDFMEKLGYRFLKSKKL